jgi:hypothetical protein
MENDLETQARIRNMPENARQADGYHVARAMIRGGGFMTALSEAFRRADLDNRRLIFASWGDSIQHEWEAYRRQGGW